MKSFDIVVSIFGDNGLLFDVFRFIVKSFNQTFKM